MQCDQELMLHSELLNPSYNMAISHSWFTAHSNVISINPVYTFYFFHFLSFSKLSFFHSLSVNPVFSWFFHCLSVSSSLCCVIGYRLISSLSFSVLILYFSFEFALILHLRFMWRYFLFRSCIVLDHFPWLVDAYRLVAESHCNIHLLIHKIWWSHHVLCFTQYIFSYII